MNKQSFQRKGSYTKLILYFLHFLLLIVSLKGFAAVVPSTIVPGQVERQLKKHCSYQHRATL